MGEEDEQENESYCFMCRDDVDVCCAGNIASVKDYTVFVLKALGYDMNDFTYADTMSFAVQKGLISASDKTMLESAKFTRGEMVYLSYNSLFTNVIRKIYRL